MSNDKYISELDPVTGNQITGSYSFVIQEPLGRANSTRRISIAEVLNWIKTNTNYTQIYDFPIEQVDVVGDTAITIIENYGDSPIQRSEVIRVKASSKKVGIMTQDPQSTLEVWSSDPVYGDIMITPESGDRMGLHVTPSNDDASPDVPAHLHLGRKIYGQDAAFTPLISIEETGNVEIGVNNTNTVMTVNGFTKFGHASPEIRMIHLRGTTGTLGASPSNEVSSVAHGLDYDKIISCNVLVKDSFGNLIGPNERLWDDRLYTITIDPLYVNVIIDDSSPTRSSKVEASEFVCTLIYIK